MLWGKKKKDKKVDEPDELIEDEYADEEWAEDDYEDEPEEKLPFKQRVLRSLRNAAIAFVVLIVLVGGAGAAYVWYVGENSVPNETAIAKPVDPSVKKEVKPLQRDPNAPIGVSFQMLSSPVTPGANAGVTIQSTPGVTCKISVELNKVPLKDSGLADKMTDDYGVLSWTWTMPADAPIGKWPVKITCISPAKKSAVMQGDLEVVAALPEN